MSYTINRWVRGRDFYGRDDLLNTLLDNSRKTRWVLGNRRVGKTSLLRQLEWRCRQNHWQPGYALYWDLQGAATSEGLKDAFLEALEDSEEVTDNLNLDVDDLDAFSFFEIVSKFRRKVKSGDRPVWLLIDECEELVDIAVEEPNVAASFRKLSHVKGLNVVLAGSHRLMDLDESRSRTSPFLPDFLPPLLLEPFQQNTTLQLLTARGHNEATAREIEGLTFGNPHLVQVMGEQWSRLACREKVLAELQRTKVCHYYFQSNFQCLPESLRHCFNDGNACETVARIAPADPLFGHLRQAALVRLTRDEDVEISPLLKLVEQGTLAGASDTPSSKKTPQTAIQASKPAEPKVHKSHALLELAQTLTAMPRIPSVLPEGALRQQSFGDLANAALPPGLELMASLEEPPKKVMAVLEGASPEYVLGKSTDERTGVYLMGLVLYHSMYGTAPFSELEDPWERAGAIADRDVPLPPTSQQGDVLPAQAPIILTRCLRANPANRYASIQALLNDWQNACR